MSRFILIEFLVLCTVYTSFGLAPATTTYYRTTTQSECYGYPVGKAFRPNPCTVCRCDYYGKKHCVSICCKPLAPCKKLVTPYGQCCPICQVCYFGGEVLQHGSTVQPHPCVHCACKYGYLYCKVAQCNTYIKYRGNYKGLTTCRKLKYIDGQCCPVCVVGKDEICAAQGGVCLHAKTKYYYGYKYTAGYCDYNKVCVYVPKYSHGGHGGAGGFAPAASIIPAAANIVVNGTAQ